VLCKNDSENLLSYYKYDDAKTDHTLMICSLDPYQTVQGMVRLPLEEIGNRPVRVTDLITGNSYIWDREWNFVSLSPALPFHLFKIER
jgi:starch synthase (maltosyl-transferring)